MTTLANLTSNILPITAFIGGVTISLALPKIAQRFKAKPVEQADQKIQDLFRTLLIKEWNLPNLSTHVNQNFNSKKPMPIFSKKTQDEIDVLKQRMDKSNSNDGKSPLPNLIVQGEPGVGKTMLIEDLCFQSGVGFIRLPSGVMESHLKTGTHISVLHKIFEIAEQCLKPVYIIMDDGEQLVAKRPLNTKLNSTDLVKADWIVDKEKMSETIAQRRVALVNAILEESGKDVRKMGFSITTNRPDVIDQAFITRAHTICINPPGEQERTKIIIQHLPTIFQNNSDILSFFDQRILANMAKKTEGFTGRNIVKMLEDLYACVQIEEGDITEETIDAAIIGIKETGIKPKIQVPIQDSEQKITTKVNIGDMISDKISNVMKRIQT